MHNYAEKMFWIKSYYTSPNRIRKILCLYFFLTLLSLCGCHSLPTSLSPGTDVTFISFLSSPLCFSHSVVFIPHLLFASASLSLSFTVFFKPYKKPQPHPDALSAVITLLSRQWKSQRIRRSVFSFSPSIHPSLPEGMKQH